MLADDQTIARAIDAAIWAKPPEVAANKVVANKVAAAALDLGPARVRYLGTSIAIQPHANGAALELQRNIANLLARNDFVPEQRWRYFPWIEERHVTVTQWAGRIEQLDAAEGKGYFVTVRFWPRHTGGFTVLRSAVSEKYRYASGQLHYISSYGDETQGITVF